MGAEGAVSGSISRGSVMSDVPALPQCLPLDPISLGSQKYTRLGELRRALGFSLGSASEDHPLRTSSFKPYPPVATEELKQFRENVLDASIKASERSKMFRESIFKLEKYREGLVKKRQRTDALSNEKQGVLKIAGQPSRNLLDQSAQRLEDKAKCAGLNKRFRSTTADLRAESKSGNLSKSQISNEKETNITKPVSGDSVQPEEKIRRISSAADVSQRSKAVTEGWDKKMKRKRSVGTVANRSTDSDLKRTMNSKMSTDSKLISCEASSIRSNANQGISSGSPSTVIKAKISRAPRTGSIMAVNSFSDLQPSSEACEGWEQPTNTNKAISLGVIQNHNRAANSSRTLGQWVGQRQQKSSRSRRTNVVSPVSNHEDGQIAPLSSPPPGIGARNSLNGNSGCLESVDLHENTPNSKIQVESTQSPGRLLAGEEARGLEHKVEAKEVDFSDVGLNGKGKVRAFLFPTKKNKHAVNDNTGDGVRRQGRTTRGLPLSRPAVSPCETKSENMSLMKPIQNMRSSSDKIKSKSGRPPSKKMSDGRACTRTPESDDDHEEMLAAATSARKASYLSCSGRFWKKIEPIFGPVSPHDTSYLKQQLSFAEELEEGLSQIPGAEYNILGVVIQKDGNDVCSGWQGSHSNQVAVKHEVFSEGLTGKRSMEKYSSLYQRVLSALIEEDESEGVFNGNGVSMSFQCASDDSHCGSCNYADAETRDRDRHESEAESIVDFQSQKRVSGDRFSCNKSVTSNTTRNTSMSDSLYSSGRWLGDDGPSHSDVEFVSGSFQNDQGGPQPVDVVALGAFADCQYNMMCVDDRLILELQSIGLYLDTMPGLAEEEVIDQDITELKGGLCEQIGKKKDHLVKIDNAVQDDRARVKRHIEQVAMEQLIQMAYKRRMACRRNNTSKTVMRKVSKQVALGFIGRTIARCKHFELTGKSCFSEPALQSVLFASSQGSDAGVSIAIDSNTFHGATKRRIDSTKADSTSLSVLDSCVDDLERGSIDSPEAVSHSSERGWPKLEQVLHKSKKRELLLDDVGLGASSMCPAAFGSSLIGGERGKRSERDGDHSSRVTLLTTNAARVNQSAAQTNPKQQSIGTNTRGRETGLSSSSRNVLEDGCEEEPLDFSKLPLPDFDSMEQLGVSNDLSAPQDIGAWLNFDDDGLQDHDTEGLPTPMDDLSMIL